MSGTVIDAPIRVCRYCDTLVHINEAALIIYATGEAICYECEVKKPETRPARPK